MSLGSIDKARKNFSLKENEVLAGGRGGLRIFKMTDIYMPLSKRKFMMQERERAMNEAMIFVSKRGLDLVHKWRTSVYLSVDCSSFLLSSFPPSPHPFFFSSSILFFYFYLLKYN